MKFFLSLLFSSLILITPFTAFADEVILAGGCFWCLEHDLESLKGVTNATSGYSGGTLIEPNYDNHTGHQEVVLVEYDPVQIDFNDILKSYFRNIDPLDGDGQFCDRGDSYRPIIFFEKPEEEEIAQKAIYFASKELNVNLKDIKVELKPKNKFWKAEDYHQDFAERNEIRYKFYRFACGRDKRLDELWKNNSRTNKSWNQ